MANIFDGFFKQIATGDSVKDYKHASRLFVDNNYARSPKYDWLYHVFFDVDSRISNLNAADITEAGMLVKSVNLPNYTVDVKVQNNYNKKELIQTKLNYGEIAVTFHDDQSEVVRNLWYDYYTHYYRDNDGGYSDTSGHISPNYHVNNKYQAQKGDFYDKFGYSPGPGKKDAIPVMPPELSRYFTAIRVYSLHQKRFSEYTLINPVITNFTHGTHNASSNGVLEHSMTISFTTVLYAGGNVSTATVAGFADLHYDKSPSPLTPAGGGTNSILGPGGILSAVDSIVGEASGANFGSAAFTAFRAFQKNKNVDLRGLGKGELIQITKDVLRRNEDPRNNFFIPTTGVLANSGLFGTAASATQSAGITEFSDKRTTGSVRSNGGPLAGTVLGQVTSQISSSLSGFPLDIGGAFSSITSGAAGLISGAPINKILNFSKSGDGITGLSETTSPESSGFAGKLGQIGKNIRQSVNAGTDQDLRGLAGVANGLTAAAPGIANNLQQLAPTFLAGTSTIFSKVSSILGQTPFGSLNIPKELAVANDNASEFIATGNKQILADNRIPTSTNPMNISGSVPS